MNFLNNFNPYFLLKKNPQSLIFFVTAKCNCSCKMCFYLDQINNQNSAHELTINEISEFSKNYGKLKFLSLSGGEPLLRPDLKEIIEIFIKNNSPQIIDLPTNGSLTENLIQFIENLCSKYKNILFNLQLSVDALDEQHNKIRNHPNLFEKITNTNSALKNLAAVHKNLKIQIVTVLSEFNKDSIKDFYEHIAKTFFFDRLIISEVHGANVKGKINNNFFAQVHKSVYELNKKKKPDFVSRFYNDCNLLTYKNFQKIKLSSNLGRYCNAGKTSVVLRENGDICACEPLWYSFGNIREYNYDIKNILTGSQAKEFYSNIRKDCHCNWSCAQTNALIYNSKNWYLILYYFIKNLLS